LTLLHLYGIIYFVKNIILYSMITSDCLLLN